MYATSENNVYFTIVPDKNYFMDEDNLKLDYSKLEQIMKDGINAKYIPIKDELKIDAADIEFSVEKNMIAAYRDLVEGGKPQFLFAAKVNRTHNEITQEFIKQVKEKKKKTWKNRWDKEQKELEDGEVLLWISVSELKEMAISAEGMVYRQKEYAMMPSASAAIVMLIRWLDESDGWRKYGMNK